MSIIKSKFIIFSVIVFLICCSFISCDSKTDRTVERIKKNFKKEGYTITEYDTILDDIKVTRVLATKGSSYYDVCFNVVDSDIDKVNDFYATTYSDFYKLNSNSGKGLAICCGDKAAYDIAGIDIVELKPIVIK
jgi:hypothetical protein